MLVSPTASAPLDTLGWFRDPLVFLDRVVEARGPYAEVRLFNRKSRLITDPDGLHLVFVKEAKKFTRDSPVYRAMATVLHESILTTEGPDHLHHRRMMQPAFKKTNLDQHVERMATLAEGFFRDLATAGTQRKDMWEAMMELTLEVVVQTILGSESTDDHQAVGWAAEAFQEYSGPSPRTMLGVPMWVPFRANRDAAKAHRILDRITYRLIDGDAQPNSALSHLQAVRDDAGRGLSRERLRNEALTLLAAGHDTTANALAWTYHLLSHEREWQERCREEVARVVGDGPITAAHLKDLVLCRAVIDESMRIFPPAYMTARRTLEEVTLPNGETLPPATDIMASPWATHRSERVWERAKTFDPSRWLDGGQPPHRYAYIPFGAGAHKCIGDQFALREAVTVLATALRHLDLQPTQSFEAVRPDPQVTIKPRGGLPLIIRPRKAPAGRATGRERRSVAP